MRESHAEIDILSSGDDDAPGAGAMGMGMGARPLGSGARPVGLSGAQASAEQHSRVRPLHLNGPVEFNGVLSDEQVLKLLV